VGLNGNWQLHLQIFNELVSEEHLIVVKFTVPAQKLDESIDEYLGTLGNQSFLLDGALMRQ